MPIVEDKLVRVFHEAWGLLLRGFVEALVIKFDLQAPRQQERPFVQRLGIGVCCSADARQVRVQP